MRSQNDLLGELVALCVSRTAARTTICSGQKSGTFISAGHSGPAGRSRKNYLLWAAFYFLAIAAACGGSPSEPSNRINAESQQPPAAPTMTETVFITPSGEAVTIRNQTWARGYAGSNAMITWINAWTGQASDTYHVVLFIFDSPALTVPGAYPVRRVKYTYLPSKTSESWNEVRGYSGEYQMQLLKDRLQPGDRFYDWTDLQVRGSLVWLDVNATEMDHRIISLMVVGPDSFYASHGR